MNMLRWAPSIMVAGGVCLLGFSLAGISKARVTALSWLLEAAQLLGGYVNNYGMLLGDALRLTAGDMHGEAADYLLGIAARMDEGARAAFSAALEDAARAGGSARALSDADRQAVARFAARFVKGREECRAAFDALEAELGAQLADAKAAAARDGRMYRSLGILAGIAAGILLM